MSELMCLGCGESDLEVVLSLGKMPLANAFLSSADLAEPDAKYPLELAFCAACALAQLTVSVDPELLFRRYPYFSSYSTTMLSEAEKLARRLTARLDLGADDLAMEIGSNDGYLLQHYRAAGVQVLGIDPAENIAAVAEQRGIETLCEFFGVELAEELRAAGRRASVIHANNVIAHVPDINGVVRGIARVLADDGVAVIETPYLRDLVERVEFDTIYHEHLFYYSLTSLARLLERHGMEVVEVERLAIHGGSLRAFAARSGAQEVEPGVPLLLTEEYDLGMDRPAFFGDLATRVDELRAGLTALLADLSSAGARIAGYGAAAKGTVLLNAFGIDCLEYVADRNPHKHGLHMPGVHTPIVPADRLAEDRPEYVLLLAWNFADEILEQQSEYRAGGGRFIVPLPEPRVVG